MVYRDAVDALEMVSGPTTGRRFEVRRRVRLGDSSPQGPVRLDAVARYLQDIANDDARDAGVRGSDLHGWVVRRTVIDMISAPRYLAELDLLTWCGGVGAGWVDRRTRLSGLDGTIHAEASALWVHVDPRTLRPQRLSPELRNRWAGSAAGRSVRARTVLDATSCGAAERIVPWPLRVSDFDGFGHMNNAAYWEIVEEFLSVDRDASAIGVADVRRYVVEHLDGIIPGDEVLVAVHRLDSGITSNDDVVLRVTVGDTVKAICFAGIFAR